MNMDDMISQAQKYSGKTTGIADMLDEMQGTYEDKILPTMGGKYWKNSKRFLGLISNNIIVEFGLIYISETPSPDGFNLKGISGYIRNGAGMMNSAASLMKQFKGIISWNIWIHMTYLFTL